MVRLAIMSNCCYLCGGAVACCCTVAVWELLFPCAVSAGFSFAVAGFGSSLISFTVGVFLAVKIKLTHVLYNLFFTDTLLYVQPFLYGRTPSYVTKRPISNLQICV